MARGTRLGRRMAHRLASLCTVRIGRGRQLGDETTGRGKEGFDGALAIWHRPE